MSRPVQIPADVDREDTLIGQLTARQVAVLATTAALLYGLWHLCGPGRLPMFAAAGLPLVLVGIGFTVGRRDGMALDRLLWAALRQRAALPTVARRRATHPAAGDGAPAGSGRARSGRVVAAPAPLRGVRAVGSDRLGVVDLGGFGAAAVCAVSPINLWLRSAREQDAVVAGFARWVQSLSAPVQILTRTRPLDLSGSITRLHHAAQRLPDAGLARAARAHAGHLRDLDAHAELLHREFLIVFRDPGASCDGPRARAAAAEALRRRALEAGALLGAVGLRVTPLRAPDAAAALRRATVPATALSGEGGGVPPAAAGGSPGAFSSSGAPRTPAGSGDAPTVELPVVLPWPTEPPRPFAGDDLDHDDLDHDHDPLDRDEPVGRRADQRARGGVR